MERDDLDAPYAGAASAFCPSCGQPKGRGYGCAVLPQALQNEPGVDSGAVALSDDPNAMPRQEGTLVERPDLEGIRERLGVLNSNTWGFLRADDELWRFRGSHDCVSALAELVDDAQALIDYAARLERAPNAIALATEVLEHIHGWATLDPEGERFPWIVARTAEALAALAAARREGVGDE